ncbi:energy-coupling factor transporter transmembrane protein EcfT [Blautia faecis]|jgi:energy-coupling factor transporter transmembrane protein EcfT|uniref:energy-coupling factor transporter transmembrane component T n=1 Tax=Blautia faecis TaxID=871665 RepID=UPI0016565790|nr:energy-coupling factor transporter transmembrane component T [Blautia faecis]MBC8615412.1 energy-coupling factor transporter transmembrane protein EcfT [Blautia faecis]
MKKRQLYVDARTKIFLMLVMNIVLLNTGSGAFLSCLRFVIGFLPGIMFLLIRRYKTAGLYTAIYAGSYFIMEYVLASVSGIAAILLGFLASMGTRFLPGGMLGVYFFCSTRVNEFVASMERMHIPQKVIIPISVMFRFFPTVKEEAQGIRDAMRMRKIGFSNPAQILEYHLVPLMISVVNIGEDLSASALTRCLGREKDRTNISRCGFGFLDTLLFAAGSCFLILYFLTVGGLISNG